MPVKFHLEECGTLPTNEDQLKKVKDFQEVKEIDATPTNTQFDGFHSENLKQKEVNLFD